jgi:hypothetical protein
MCKDYVKHLGANKTEKAISRFSRCMGPLFNILSKYDNEHRCHSNSSSHTSPSSVEDRDIIIEELMEKARVFQQMPTRSHFSFPNFSCNPIRKLDWDKFKTWLDKQAKAKGCSLN